VGSARDWTAVDASGGVVEITDMKAVEIYAVPAEVQRSNRTFKRGILCASEASRTNRPNVGFIRDESIGIIVVNYCWNLCLWPASEFITFAMAKSTRCKGDWASPRCRAIGCCLVHT